MRVMGLDLSTKTGLAVVDATKAVVHAEMVTSSTTGMPRINDIVGRILDVHQMYKPHLLCVEDYAVGKFAGSAITSIEIGAVLRFICWQQDIPLLEVAPTTLKKFLTGGGKAKKEHMMLELFKRFGYSAATNDIADAVALGLLGVCLWAPGLFTKQQQSAARPPLDTAPSEILSLLNIKNTPVSKQKNNKN